MADTENYFANSETLEELSSAFAAIPTPASQRFDTYAEQAEAYERYAQICEDFAEREADIELAEFDKQFRGE